MKTNYRLVVGGVVLLAATALVGATEPARQPAVAADSSGEPLIATAGRLAQGDSAELKQLIAQLNLMKQERAVLGQQRNARQAELDRLASGDADAARAAQLRSQIYALQTQLDALDQKIQLLNHRIQSLQAREATASGGQATQAVGVKPQPALPGATLAKPVHPIAHDQIVAAAAKLVKNGAISEAGARNSAQTLLMTNNRPVTNSDIEQLVVQVLAQANKDANADLRDQMAVVKRNNAQKQALRNSTTNAKDQKDNLPDMSETDQMKLQLLQDRKAKIEQLLSDMMKKTSDTADSVTKNMK